MNVSKTDYLKIDFDNETKMLKALWFPKSKELSDDEYKKELYTWRDMIEKHKPERLFVDTREMLFVIGVDMQEWFVNEIFGSYSSFGVKKNAHILPKEVAASVSVEQALDDDEKAAYETQYFDDEQKALNWLKK